MIIFFYKRWIRLYIEFSMCFFPLIKKLIVINYSSNRWYIHMPSSHLYPPFNLVPNTLTPWINCSQFLFVEKKSFFFQNFPMHTQGNTALSPPLFTQKVTYTIMYSFVSCFFHLKIFLYLCTQCFCSFLQHKTDEYHNLFCRSLVHEHLSCFQS